MQDKIKQSSFKIQFDFAEKQYKQMGRTIEKMKLWFEIDDLDRAYFEAFDFANQSEQLTLSARNLPAYTGNPQANKLSEKVVDKNIPVRIGFTPEGWFGVVIPTLLPKKYKGSTDYIRGFLYSAMQNFFHGKQPIRYDDCVIIFKHIYKHDRPERQYRDHDNIELNAVVDTVALYTMYYDAPLRCEHHYLSASGDDNRTEILVVPQSEFMMCYANLKNQENKELILYETCV